MELLKQIPPNMTARAHKNHVAVLCDCGATLLWERGLGNHVRHIVCGAEATLNVDGTIKPETEVVDGAEQVKVADGPTV